jgi:hypothetical protein
MKRTTLPLQTSTNHSQCPLALLLVPFAVTCFALAQLAEATCQEGCDLTHANTRLGDEALSHSGGSENTAVGKWALRNNTSGFSNTAFGINALTNETTGHDNTAIGGDAMYNNVDGNDNTAVGDTALWPAHTQSPGSESRRTPYSIRMSSISSSVATLNRARRRAMSSRITNVLSSSSGSMMLIRSSKNPPVANKKMLATL